MLTLRLPALVVAIAAVALPMAAPVAAHNGVDPWLEVDSPVVPDGRLSVVGGELDRDGLVRLTLWVDGQTYRVGELRADGEGHFAGALPLPAEVDVGYGQLTAASDYLDVSLWIEIGGVDGGRSTGSDAAWIRRLVTDPSVLMLGALLVGGALALAYRVLLSHGRRPQTARR